MIRPKGAITLRAGLGVTVMQYTGPELSNQELHMPWAQAMALAKRILAAQSKLAQMRMPYTPYDEICVTIRPSGKRVPGNKDSEEGGE